MTTIDLRSSEVTSSKEGGISLIDHRLKPLVAVIELGRGRSTSAKGFSLEVWVGLAFEQVSGELCQSSARDRAGLPRPPAGTTLSRKPRVERAKRKRRAYCLIRKRPEQVIIVAAVECSTRPTRTPRPGSTR